jgi:hypothetical protein
MKERKR